MKNKAEIIVVGAGLAGTILAIELKLRGFDCILIDSNSRKSSSVVAAGLFNPINSNSLKKLWLVDEMFVKMVEFYQKMEAEVNCKFLHFMPQINFYDSPKIERQLDKIDTYYSSYQLEKRFDFANDFYASLQVLDSGYLDVKMFLSSMHSTFILDNSLVYEDVRYNDFDINNGSVAWQDINADMVVFCEGQHATENPWFPKDALAKTKGELLIVECKELPETVILKNGVFILPIGNHQFKVGATYNRYDLADVTTSMGVEWLKKGFERISNCKYRVLNHLSGIRPNPRDRKPILGFHSKNSTIAFFNGFGSRGVLQIPYWANVMANAIKQSKQQLPKEVSLNRFCK